MTMLYASFSMMLYRSGVVLVHHLTHDNTATGLFATALQMAEFVWVLVIAVEGVMLQSTARLWREGRTEELTELISLVVRYTSLVTGFLLTYVFVFAEDLLALYFGPAFAGAAPVLRILIPGVFSFSLGRLLGPVLHARGRVLRLAGVVGAATALNAILAVVLVPIWGIAGAGVSTGIAYGIVLLPYAYSLRVAGVKPFHAFGPLRQLTLFLGTGATLALLSLVPLGKVFHTVAGGIAGGFVFAALALRLGLVSIRELEAILESLPHAMSAPGRRLFQYVRPVMAILEGRRDGSV
jgi:O-antigen/teichoic acid export membrane protein